ncbi:MAG: hypothetical protein MUC50_24070 [Myxococcota bacterium]|jgi:hypothetical protein|nr:hypothetical protein [Myxococcota bacterium]
MNQAHETVGVLRGFAAHLGTKHEQGGVYEKLKALSLAGSGYEPWLKYELALWLMLGGGRKKSYEVSVEKELALSDEADKKAKHVDVAYRDGGSDAWNYVELKTIFVGVGQINAMFVAATSRPPAPTAPFPPP